MTTKLSVIVPCYNVVSKIHKCFTSLEKLQAVLPEIEVLFVDDRSTDSTFESLNSFARTRPWTRVFQLNENSGTPSVPRNFALEQSKGEYVFHLDPDDEILPDGILAELEIADRTQADMVRAPLIRKDSDSVRTMNVIDDWNSLETGHSRIQAIVRNHSTTVCGLYRRTFLLENELKWPEGLRLAEDAIYLYKALSKGLVEYSSTPDFVYHTAVDSLAASSTQRYQESELENHIEAWETSTEILKSIGIDYMALRGQVALSAAFHNMIRFNVGGLSKKNLARLHAFLVIHQEAVRKFSYGKRFSELRDLLLNGSLDEFNEAIKLRLVIAGYDLRFILPAVQYLAEYYQVRVDEWTGHETHDESKSERLLKWADSIHCEWMLGNAVWYSTYKLKHQTMQIRLHRFETSRDYGRQIKLENVDRIITIAPAMFEETVEVFGYPRELVRYAPNYIETGSYATSNDPAKVFNLTMVGSVPIRKGFRRALELLKLLNQIDPRYNLTVYGKRAEELGWVIRDPKERDYFADCERFVRQNGLEHVVNFEGWVDTKQALADKGFVLSMSDAEGSHVAAAEGFAAHNITLLRPWEGSEFMYPSDYIFDSIEDMRDYVLECRDFDVFETRAQAGIDYVETRYSMDEFISHFKELLPVPGRVV